MTSLKEWMQHLPWADLESSHDDALDPHVEGYIKELEQHMSHITDDDSYNAGYRAAREEALRFLRGETPQKAT